MSTKRMVVHPFAKPEHDAILRQLRYYRGATKDMAMLALNARLDDLAGEAV